MTSDLYELRAGWGPRAETAEECATRLIRMIEAVIGLHPGFPLMAWPGANGMTMDKLLRAPSRIEILSKAFRPRPIGASDDVDTKGFDFSASTALENSRALTMQILAGHQLNYPYQAWFPNIALLVMNTRDDGYDNYGADEAIKPALLSIISAWEPDFAGAYSWNFGQYSHAARPGHSFFQGMWMVYLSAVHANGFSAPSVSINEAVAGGLLMSATDGSFDPLNLAQVSVA